MLFVLRYGEARVLDVCLNFSGVDVGQTRLTEALSDKELRSRDMIGGQGCVRCSGGYAHQITCFTRDILSIAITPTYPSYIADVVAQQRDRKMKPITRRNAAVPGVFSA